jgi:serine/threonine protein kinase
MSESEVVKVALQLCDIVGYLHHHVPPIVHRDLTPENLMIQNDDTIVLLDFNVAKELDPIATTHTIVGKHNYIPPEQFRGNASTQSDIYAMGGTIFWLLTGQEPEPISVAHPRDIAAHVSEWMDQLVATATEQDLNCRFNSIEDVQAALASRAK